MERPALQPRDEDGGESACDEDGEGGMTTKPKRHGGPAAGGNLAEALAASFDEALRTPEGTETPVALLWTDPDGQWSGIVSDLRKAIPQICTLGEYSPTGSTGPAIWLRCVVERTVAVAGIASETLPILYLPRVARQALRAASDCPPALAPLVELQYRGRLWHQRNGRDWTVDAFVVSEDGLGLDVAQDARTREALQRALPLLLATPLEALRGKRLDADDFDRLAVSDPARDLLRWLGAPEEVRKSQDEARWKAFCNICKTEFGFDPDRKTPRDAAKLLIESTTHKWPDAWRRFTEAPRIYPGVVEALREAPTILIPLPGVLERIPRVNAEKEEELGRSLDDVAALPHAEACARVLELEAAHGTRRSWVWAHLGESPLAAALAPLAELASLAVLPVGGANIEAAVQTYVDGAWRCDRAALAALGSLQPQADSAVVQRVVQALYLPWLDASARHFQDLVSADEQKARAAVELQEVEDDTCIVFADGLRFDLGHSLKERLEQRGLRASIGHRLAPLPTVTATAKPAACHVHLRFKGVGAPGDFTPVLEGTGHPATAVRLRQQMAVAGIDVIGTGDPRPRAAGASIGWTETGRLDELGHKLGAALVQQVEGSLAALADHVESLLNHGWLRVVVVTDHGWLLVPGGLPKIELPAHLVETKWSRCASVVGESTPSVPTYGWHWQPGARLASPPGVGSFIAGAEYAHGGLSPQECVVPVLHVERAGGPIRATIESVSWRGMRCRVAVKSDDRSVRLDLRLNWKQPDTSIVASIKGVGSSGEASLVVDDKHEGTAATIVLLDGAGKVLDRKPTTVGEAS
jgi:hypothetical protein